MWTTYEKTFLLSINELAFCGKNNSKSPLPYQYIFVYLYCWVEGVSGSIPTNDKP